MLRLIDLTRFDPNEKFLKIFISFIVYVRSVEFLHGIVEEKLIKRAAKGVKFTT